MGIRHCEKSWNCLAAEADYYDASRQPHPNATWIENERAAHQCTDGVLDARREILSACDVASAVELLSSALKAGSSHASDLRKRIAILSSRFIILSKVRDIFVAA